MSNAFKGSLGLVLWLLAGFAFTEFTTLALSGGLLRKAPVGSVEADQTVAAVRN